MVEERIITARVITLEVQSKCADDLLEEMQMDEWGMRRRGWRELWSGGG